MPPKKRLLPSNTPDISKYMKKGPTSDNSSGGQSSTNENEKNTDDKPKAEKTEAKKKYDRDQKRSVQAAWFAEFGWLQHNAEKKLFFCKLCCDCKESNIFTSGKDASKPKKDDLVKHERSEDHKNALKKKKMQKEMTAAAQNAYSHCKDAIKAQLATLLVQAKEAIPTRKHLPLISLQIFNGASSLRSLSVQDIVQYCHHESSDDMYQSLRYVVEAELKTAREASPFPLFAIEADEATDSANKSILLVYVRYMSQDGDVTSKFLSVCEMPGTRSEEIFDCIQKILLKHGLFEVDLIGLATDGASTMVGVHKGVATRFKDECPWLITNHCMAHRLQLVSQKAANNVPYLVKYIATLNLFAKSLKFSPKMCRILETCKDLTGEKATKIKQVFFTRWLSFQDSVQALVNCVSSTLSCVYAAAAERDTQGRAVLHGLAKQMASFKFVAMTHFLADAMGILGVLSKSLQKEDVTYSQGKPLVDSAVVALNNLLTKPGPYMETALKDLPEKPCDSGYTLYKGHDIKDSQSERKKYTDSVEAFVANVVEGLEIAFPDSDMMSCFSVFNPKVAPHDVGQLNKLCSHFSTHVDKYAALIEWQLLEQVMQQDIHKATDAVNFYKAFLHPNREAYPNLSRLAAIGVIVPVTSVNCERGISRYNSIKTDSRSGLSVEHVDTLMILSLESQPLEKFDFDKAFSHWMKSKDRRGFLAMVKTCQTRQTPCAQPTTSDGGTQDPHRSELVVEDSAENIPLDLSTHN